jgi:hypothetical protein
LKEKRKYIKPVVNEIKIDNEISLIMMTGESDPPGGPWDNGNGNNNGSDNNDSKNKKESPFKH